MGPSATQVGRSRPQMAKSAMDWMSQCHAAVTVASFLLFVSSTTAPLPPISVASACSLVSVLPPSEPPPATLSHPVMSSVASQDTASTTPHQPNSSIREEDWDRSESDIQLDGDQRTPRNSVLFPADRRPDLSPGKGCRRGNRTLSELLKLYAEDGTDCQFSQDEATRIADVLGQWVRLIPFSFALSRWQDN